MEQPSLPYHIKEPWLWDAQAVVRFFSSLKVTTELFSDASIRRAFLENDVTGIAILGDFFDTYVIRDDLKIVSLSSRGKIMLGVTLLRQKAKALGYDEYCENLSGLVSTYVDTGLALPLLRDRPVSEAPLPSSNIQSDTPEPDQGPFTLCVGDLNATVTRIKVPRHLLTASTANYTPAETPLTEYDQKQPSMLPTPLASDSGHPNSDSMTDDVVEEEGEETRIETSIPQALDTGKKRAQLFTVAASQNSEPELGPLVTEAADIDETQMDDAPGEVVAKLEAPVSPILRSRKPRLDRYLQNQPLTVDDIFFGVYPDVENEASTWYEGPSRKVPAGTACYVNSRMKHFLGLRAEQETDSYFGKYAVAFRPYTARFLRRYKKHSITVISRGSTRAGEALREHISNFGDLASDIYFRHRSKDTMMLLDPTVADHLLWLDQHRDPYGDEMFDVIGMRWGPKPRDHDSQGQESQESVLPVFGESGSEGEDEETARDMEREERQKLKAETKKKPPGKPLDEEIVVDIINKTVNEVSEKIRERIERKGKDLAYKYWKRARGNKAYRIKILKSLVKDAMIRLDNIVEELIIRGFYKEKEVETETAKSVRTILEEIEESKWEVEVLRGDKPSKPTQPTPTSSGAPRREATPSTDSETESEEDGDDEMRDFIVDDEEEEDVDMSDDMGDQILANLSNGLLEEGDEVAEDSETPSDTEGSDHSENARRQENSEPKAKRRKVTHRRRLTVVSSEDESQGNGEEIQPENAGDNQTSNEENLAENDKVNQPDSNGKESQSPAKGKENRPELKDKENQAKSKGRENRPEPKGKEKQTSPRVKTEASTAFILPFTFGKSEVIDLTSEPGSPPPVSRKRNSGVITIADSDEELESAPGRQINNEIRSAKRDYLSVFLLSIENGDKIPDQTRNTVIELASLSTNELRQNLEAYSKGSPSKAANNDTDRGYACLKSIYDCWAKANRKYYTAAGASGSISEGKKLEDFLDNLKDCLNGGSGNARGRRLSHKSDQRQEPLASTSTTSASNNSAPPRPKRRRALKIDEAANQRRMDKEKARSLQQRRQKEQEKRAMKQGGDSQSAKSDKTLLNVGRKQKKHDPIYLPSGLGDVIQQHQMEGIRFIWNEVITTENQDRGGALLAHTMGLGKTFQIISLLYMIAKCSLDPNDRIRNQIPEELRHSKTLIIAPASLLRNWRDEFSKWMAVESDEDQYNFEYIGRLYIYDNSSDDFSRGRMLQDFHESGGVLLIGYPLFTRDSQKDGPAGKILLDSPNLVVADEAHFFKNPNAKINKLVNRIKTRNRIALTGSPLSNNLSEYFHIIDWLDKGYLGDKKEFRDRYEVPIGDGLYYDSSREAQRTSLVQLRTLRRTIEPKVHRCGLDALAEQLPKKTEFLITVPLTDAQRDIYAEYVKHVRESDSDAVKGFLDFWFMLGLLLSHPHIFMKTLEQRKAKGLQKILEPSQIDEVNGEDNKEGDEEANGPSSPSGNVAPTVERSELEEMQLDILGDVNNTMYHKCKFYMSNLGDEKMQRSLGLSNRLQALVDILMHCHLAEEKVLVFSRSLVCLDFIGTYLNEVVGIRFSRMDGKVPTSQRVKLTKQFNEDKNLFVFLISTRAGALGLNIPSASRVVIFDFSFAPHWEEQAVGRAYRLGQTKPVFVYRFRVGGTFEDIVYNKALFKTQLAFRVVDQKNTIRASQKEELMAWFTDPKDVEQEPLDKYRGRDPLVLDKVLPHGYIRDIKLQETFEQHHEENLTAEEERQSDMSFEIEQQARKQRYNRVINDDD